MTRACLIGLICMSLTLAVARADEVTLKDGSKLVGAVERLDGGKLKIKTEFAGDLEIDAAKVKSIATEAPVNVRLKTGDTVLGKLGVTPAGEQIVTGDAVGQKPVAEGDVTAVWGKDGVSPEVAEAQAKYEAARAKWSLHLEFGIDGQTGNTERVGVNGRAEAKRVTDSDRLSIYGQGRYTRENGNDTTREIIGGTLLEVDLNETWFAWGRVELENDKFENLDLRATAAGGLGVWLIRKPTQEWKARGGPGIQFESYTDGTDETHAIVELGHDYWVELAPWLKYVHTLTFFVPVDDVNDWRAVMENAGEIPLNKDQNWKLRVGVRNQYDAQPVEGIDRLDTYYFMNIAWDWK